MTPAIMLQGTGSDVGKSLLVAGLCRLFARRGLAVRPFKPQNMSNNAAATTDGGEIGRAQALQARAAGIPATVDMNPVLLKPESERGAQVIVCGHRRATVAAADYQKLKPQLLGEVLAAFERLSQDADLMIVEGAGSPAEINLRTADIANMGFAHAAGVPVVLVGDIDRGGVIASLVGTAAVIPSADAALVKGFVVNRFRGDPALFTEGMAAVAERTGWPALGLVPWFADAARLPAEDGLGLAAPIDKPAGARIRVAVPMLPRIANFDDLDPLRLEPEVEVVFVRRGEAIPGDCALVVLPGSKSTVADLAVLRAEGWDVDLAAHRRRGGRILGLCGGYQMLGRSIADPDGIEGPPGTVAGLGHLAVDTVLTGDKVTRPVIGTERSTGRPVAGYEIHLGRTDGTDALRAFADIDGHPDGATSADGLVQGTYLHGVFGGDDFRAAFLESLGSRASLAYDSEIEAVLDRLADHLECHLDIEAILAIARGRSDGSRQASATAASIRTA